VLQRGGAAEAALQPLAEARRRFQALADAGNTSAIRMASATITETADCLTALGRLDEAAAAYEQTIKLDGERGDIRDVATGKFQLGTVRMLQGRYAEALKIYTEARDTFASLGEPRSVATAWHQIGMAHRWAEQFELAERAYRQSLAIEVQQKNIAGEARSLSELGNLYHTMGRLENAVTFYQQAANIYGKSQDLRYEGSARSNMASILIKLQQYDKARIELQRAIKCKQSYGHAALPWTAWILLHDLEQVTGTPSAAAHARQQAIQSYLAYRRDGGENQEPGAKLCALVAQAIQQGDSTEAEQVLARYLGPDAKPWAKALIPKLQAILHGSRDLALADDAALNYDDAAELLLLLERVG
jgi:tetratricopeptide (TPR) repeat protein